MITGSSTTGDHFDGATAFTARFDVDIEHTSSPKQTLKHSYLESPKWVVCDLMLRVAQWRLRSIERTFRMIT
jgi:uncharacterized protein YifN (PemK superfamily)